MTEVASNSAGRPTPIEQEAAPPRRRIPKVGENGRDRFARLGEKDADSKSLVDEHYRALARRPGESPDAMFFRYWGTNPFVEASVDPMSTFAVDVDTASYTLTRNYLQRNLLPPAAAIRTEEFINYFKPRYTPPTDDAVFAVATELSLSPFSPDASYRLLRVGVKGREVTREKRQRASLVFVVDVSSSMAREGRLELVKDGLRLLVAELHEGDTIGIVEFDTTARTVLNPTPADQSEVITHAINTLHPNSSTNVDGGLSHGYNMAAAHLISDGSNRVLLLSDGVANTGATDTDSILNRVKTHRDQGIYLTCVGVGMGNHNDVLMEQLADRGDGRCVYVDRLDEARKVFVENLTGTLQTIARDVKIQVEFDQKRVSQYRLLGYENRAIADADFRNDRIDAGEVGAGHEVTALYELKMAPSKTVVAAPAVGKPVPDASATDAPLAIVRLRYLKIDDRQPVEFDTPVNVSAEQKSFSAASPRYRLAVLVAEFAEILRASYWARGSDLERVAQLTQDLLGDGEDKLGNDAEVAELVALMRQATPLVRQRLAQSDSVTQAVDALKENTYLKARLEEVRTQTATADERYLENLRSQNAELRRQLETLLKR